MRIGIVPGLAGSAGQRRLWAGSLAVALLISVVVAAVAWRDLPYLSTDSPHYIELAEGRPQNVNEPFNTRVLHPALVRLLAGATGLTTDQAFLAWGLLALITLSAAVALILTASSVPHAPIAASAILATPFLFDLFRDYYLPDLFHAALLALFFLVSLRAGHHVKYTFFGLLLLFLLYLTRESTLLLSAAVVAVSLWHGQRRLAVSAVAVTLLGMLVASLAGRLGQPNVHAMNDLLYLALKLPFNFAKNILGFTLWTDTHAAINVDYCQPLFTLAVPPSLPLGSIHSVGLCTFELWRPLTTLVLLLTAFGVSPAVLFASLLRRRSQILRESPAWLLTALAYGLLAYLLGASVGAAVSRLIGYGWPAFWLAAPVLLARTLSLKRSEWLVLLACQLLAAYAILPFHFIPETASGPIALFLVGLLGLHYLVFRLLRREANSPTRRAPG